MSPDPSLIAAAVVLVLSSVGSTIVLIINAASASKDRREASKERLQQLVLAQAAKEASEAVARKTDQIIESTTKIHELTNSTNSNLQKALELMTAKVAALEQLLAQAEGAKKEAAAAQLAADLRVAQASLDRRTDRPAPAPATAAGVITAIADSPHLQAIEENTAATAENTRKDPSKAS